MKWLHISDLHYDPQAANFDTEQLLLKLEEYFERHSITVDEVFYTGDFRFAKSQEPTLENARLAADKLRAIAQKAGVSNTESIHIVPGNHDLERGDPALIKSAYERYSRGQFSGSVEHLGSKLCSADYLWSRFRFFLLVASELNNQAWLNTPTDDRFLYHRVGKIGKTHNIVYLNTALGCGRDGERMNLRAGYEYIAQTLKTLDRQIPTIVLGHHGLGCFTRDERERIKDALTQHNVRLFLCGDEHVGGVDAFDGMLQLTAGCLNQAEKGIEPTFYIGEMEPSGCFEVKAYTYQDGAYTGWSLCEPICDRISNWTNDAFPRPVRSVFGRDKIIATMTAFLTAPFGKIAEVWGVAGVGKTTVCNEVLKCLMTAHLTVDVRLCSTVIEIQRDILRQLGVHVDDDALHPNAYDTMLLSNAKMTRKTLYLDNAETAIVKDKHTFSAWLLRFARESGWRVLYSTQIQLDAEAIEPFHLSPLSDDDAFDMFANRRRKGQKHKELSSIDRRLAREIAVTLLSCHPLAIVLATSKTQNKRLLSELKDDLQRRIPHQLRDDPDNPHRSISAALSLTLSGLERSSVSAQAKELWAMLAQFKDEFSDDLFSIAYGNRPECAEARLILRNFGLIGEDNYAMLEPIKTEARCFTQEINRASRSALLQTLSMLFDKGSDHTSPDKQKWHEMSLRYLHPTLLLLAESSSDDFEMVRAVVQSVFNYFQFSAHASLATLRELVQRYCVERDNLGLANVLQAMGDLESRLGDIDAAQKHYADAEQLYRAERDNLGLANVLQSMGDLKSQLGDIDAAITQYSIACGLYERVQAPIGRVYCMSDLCLAYAHKKDALRVEEYAAATKGALGSVSENVAGYAIACVREAMRIMGISPSSDHD